MPRIVHDSTRTRPDCQRKRKKMATRKGKGVCKVRQADFDLIPEVLEMVPRAVRNILN
jgi:hypothetical protein